uniref:Uncharacterized protein n=1 Tax=Mycena chlorophos TaxID=658473 RepID=A0ABQ0KV85_MYCCL|nr:predicted protein [Mycena chlorophos]
MRNKRRFTPMGSVPNAGKHWSASGDESRRREEADPGSASIQRVPTRSVAISDLQQCAQIHSRLSRIGASRTLSTYDHINPRQETPFAKHARLFPSTNRA